MPLPRNIIESRWLPDPSGFVGLVLGGWGLFRPSLTATRYGWSVPPRRAPQVVGVEEFTGVVLPVEEVRRKRSKLTKSPLSEAASYRRGYVSSFWNFSDAAERSGRVTK
jgi:hypothetical protein